MTNTLLFFILIMLILIWLQRGFVGKILAERLDVLRYRYGCWKHGRRKNL